MSAHEALIGTASVLGIMSLDAAADVGAEGPFVLHLCDACDEALVAVVERVLRQRVSFNPEWREGSIVVVGHQSVEEMETGGDVVPGEGDDGGGEGGGPVRPGAAKEARVIWF